MRQTPALLAVLALLHPQPLAAQDAPGLAPGIDGLRAAALAQLADLPERKLAEIRRAPRRFVETAADLIYGFGTAGALDAAGIERFVAVSRAQVRARELRRLMLADLDDDGTVSGAEIAAMVAAEAAPARGRLQLAFDEADGAAGGAPDGRAGLDEIRARASAVALDEVGPADVAALRAILMFDLDGDGAVTLGEVARGVEALTGAA